MASFLQLRDVSKSYDSVLGAPPVSVLTAINLEIGPGESAAIVGPSGSGKSTLLNIIGTLDRATSGQVLLEGQDLGRLDELALAEVRSRNRVHLSEPSFAAPMHGVGKRSCSHAGAR